ncbi:MAG: cupin [Nitrospirota bacterium]|nr:cupin [Nitrospirota bacterium]
MPTLITQPSIIPPTGTQPKHIEEYAGRVATQDATVSIARIVCPPGWAENGQQPEFAETKVVLKGRIQVEHTHGVLEVQAGQAVTCHPGEWVRYSTPEGVEYLAVCVPAFSPLTVHRDPDI